MGVALKSIVYVNAAVHDLEAASGCEHAKESFRRLAWAPGGGLDNVASVLGSAQFGEHYNLAGGLGDQGGSHHRRLAGSFTLDQYDELLRKLYWLLQVVEGIDESKDGAFVGPVRTRVVPVATATNALSCFRNFPSFLDLLIPCFRPPQCRRLREA